MLLTITPTVAVPASKNTKTIEVAVLNLNVFIDIHFIK